MQAIINVIKELRAINSDIGETIILPIIKGTTFADYERATSIIINRIRALTAQKVPILDDLEILSIEDDAKYNKAIDLLLSIK